MGVDFEVSLSKELASIWGISLVLSQVNWSGGYYTASCRGQCGRKQCFTPPLVNTWCGDKLWVNVEAESRPWDDTPKWQQTAILHIQGPELEILTGYKNQVMLHSLKTNKILWIIILIQNNMVFVFVLKAPKWVTSWWSELQCGKLVKTGASGSNNKFWKEAFSLSPITQLTLLSDVLRSNSREIHVLLVKATSSCSMKYTIFNLQF